MCLSWSVLRRYGKEGGRKEGETKGERDKKKEKNGKNERRKRGAAEDPDRSVASTLLDEYGNTAQDCRNGLRIYICAGGPPGVKLCLCTLCVRIGKKCDE